MSMLADIGGTDGLHRASDAFFTHARAHPAVRAYFEAVDAPSMRAEIEEALRAHLEFEPEQVPQAMARAHEALVGKGMANSEFDALYDIYHETLSAAGVPGGMLYGFLEAFEDLRGALVAKQPA
jgi:truncated hemoglobin YjbI